MEEREQLMMRLGYDAMQFEQGTLKMLAQQENAAAKTKAIWAEADRAMAAEHQAALAKMEADDLERNKISLERLAQYQRAEQIAAEEWMAMQAAQREIAQGSIPANMRRIESGEKIAHEVEEVGLGVGTLAGGAAALKSTLGKKVVEEAAKDAKPAVHSIFREVQVLIHEGIAQRWKQFISSFSRLLGFMGMTAETLVSSIPIVGAASLAIWHGFHMRGDLKEMAGAYGTNEGAANTQEMIGKRLEKEIQKLFEAGKINGDKREELIHSLGSFSGIQRVQRELAPLLPQGYDTFLPNQAKVERDTIHSADEHTAALQKQLDDLQGKNPITARTPKQIADDVIEKTKEIEWLKKHLAAIDKDSVDYHQSQADLLQRQVDLQKDLNAQAEHQKELDRDNAEYRKANIEVGKDYMKRRISEIMDEAVFPERSNVAGRSWTKWFTGQYGAGGRYDLGRGDGPYSAMAREYIRAQYQQEWDRTYGNIAMADADRLRMTNARDSMIRVGAASPEMILQKIQSDTGALHRLFQSMVASGVVKVDIVDD